MNSYRKTDLEKLEAKRKRNRLVKGNTYEISWKDHFSDSAWKSDEEVEEWVKDSKKELCVSIGKVVYQDRQLIVLSATDDGAGNHGDLMGIYKNHIVKKKLIKKRASKRA